MFKIIKARKFGDTKSSLKFVSNENGDIHIAWDIGEGNILVFEYNPNDYPQGTYMIFDNIEEYLKSIEGQAWLN